MKILIVIASLLATFSSNGYSQITTIASPKKEVKEVLKYDSLENLTYENAPLHVGQTLYLKGNSNSKTNNGFKYTFYTKMITDSLLDSQNDKNIYNQFKPVYREDYQYKPIETGKMLGDRKETVSDYSALAGKYYKIRSVKTEKLRYNQDIIYWIELVNEDGTPFYFRRENNYISHNIFVTLGYYEKMKQTFVGKEFYSKGRYELDKIDTKEKVTLPFKIKFKCTDIAVNVGENGSIFAVLENEKYGRIKGEIIDGKSLDNFITVSYYNECIRKYGAKFGNDVAKGKIELGMNKKMVIDAWGNPKDINITNGSFGTHEQWIYNDRYLYFQNGILTSMQL